MLILSLADDHRDEHRRSREAESCQYVEAMRLLQESEIHLNDHTDLATALDAHAVSDEPTHLTGITIIVENKNKQKYKSKYQKERYKRRHKMANIR